MILPLAITSTFTPVNVRSDPELSLCTRSAHTILPSPCYAGGRSVDLEATSPLKQTPTPATNIYYTIITHFFNKQGQISANTDKHQKQKKATEAASFTYSISNSPYRRPGSNRYCRCQQTDFKSVASTNSATAAYWESTSSHSSRGLLPPSEDRWQGNSSIFTN